MELYFIEESEMKECIKIIQNYLGNNCKNKPG